MHQHADDIVAFRGKNAFLSNFAPSTVYILVGTKWVKCPTVEHAYQASKTLDQHERLRIISCATPKDAKDRGNSVDVVSYWEEVKRVVMLELLRQKFSHVPLQRALRDTGRAQLIEGNMHHDNYWGACMCAMCDEDGAEGENWLGQLLMRVRRDIR